jgi:queuine tRNA-ribosyltransferase
VARTIAWARRCKEEFTRREEQRGRADGPRRLLFGVVQGGGHEDLRRACAEALLELGCDGFGYGGWPFDGQGALLEDMLAYTRELIPAQFPVHALGVGQPGHVVTCARFGYDLFDSALPTRDARNGRLYSFASDPHDPGFRLVGDWYSYLYIHDKKHIKAAGPLSPGCRCHTCARYATGYLHHLHMIGDALYLRLATIHNLHFMMQVMRLIALGAHDG